MKPVRVRHGRTATRTAYACAARLVGCCRAGGGWRACPGRAGCGARPRDSHWDARSARCWQARQRCTRAGAAGTCARAVQFFVQWAGGAALVLPCNAEVVEVHLAGVTVGVLLVTPLA